MSKLADLKTKQEQLKKEISENAKDALGETFTELFAQHPEIAKIKWTQYTPYFNDGDPCTFRVDEFSFQRVTPDAAQLEDSEEEGWEETYVYGRGKGNPLKSAVRELAGLCDDQVLLAAFGDHVEVIASRDGFSVEEYSHD